MTGNSAAAEYVKHAQATGVEGEDPQPFPEKLGTPEWYDARHDDHLRRHAGMPPPPDYYLDYGKKYCLRFSKDLYPKLSVEGQAWIVETRTDLQVAIDDRLLEDPAAFDQLECDAAASKTFAFDTHPKAYLDGGLRSLPLADIMQIATTPDIGDLATMDGIAQVAATAPEVAPTQASKFFTEGGMLLDREHGEDYLFGREDAAPVPFQQAFETSPIDR